MIRAATSDDLDAIMSIEDASFPSDAWSVESMAAELAGEYSRYLVDVEDDVVVGYAGLRAVPGAEADVQTIAVRAEQRGHGRGRALLRALLAEASALRAREMFLEVRADNPGAEALYVSEGFIELGRRPKYYQPDGVDAIVMRLDLRAWAATRSGEENTRNGGDSGEIPPPVPGNSSRPHPAPAPAPEEATL